MKRVKDLLPYKDDELRMGLVKTDWMYIAYWFDDEGRMISKETGTKDYHEASRLLNEYVFDYFRARYLCPNRNWEKFMRLVSDDEIEEIAEAIQIEMGYRGQISRYVNSESKSDWLGKIIGRHFRREDC